LHFGAERFEKFVFFPQQRSELGTLLRPIAFRKPGMKPRRLSMAGRRCRRSSREGDRSARSSKMAREYMVHFALLRVRKTAATRSASECASSSLKNIGIDFAVAPNLGAAFETLGNRLSKQVVTLDDRDTGIEQQRAARRESRQCRLDDRQR